MLIIIFWWICREIPDLWCYDNVDLRWHKHSHHQVCYITIHIKELQIVGMEMSHDSKIIYGHNFFSLSSEHFCTRLLCLLVILRCWSFAWVQESQVYQLNWIDTLLLPNGWWYAHINSILLISMCLLLQVN